MINNIYLYFVFLFIYDFTCYFIVIILLFIFHSGHAIISGVAQSSPGGPYCVWGAVGVIWCVAGQPHSAMCFIVLCGLERSQPSFTSWLVSSEFHLDVFCLRHHVLVPLGGAVGGFCFSQALVPAAPASMMRLSSAAHRGWHCCSRTLCDPAVSSDAEVQSTQVIGTHT